jgi:hypothetical protein
MAEHIDLDRSGPLRLEYTLPESGEMLLDVVERTINGRLTCAESPRPPRVRAHQALPERMSVRHY